MKTTVIQTDVNAFDLTMEDLTEGKIMAITKALSDYSEKSVVCEDVFASFQHAIEQKEQKEKTLFYCEIHGEYRALNPKCVKCEIF